MIERIGGGARMSRAVINGGVVYVSGQVADKTAGGSVSAQTREILALIDDLLAQAGSDKSKLLMANVWLADIRSFEEMNKVWDAWVKQGSPPARATVEAKLAGPQYAVEIAVIAAQ
jgi:enamine deaminase RidA (YjgF/YER057c/UK114 family)